MMDTDMTPPAMSREAVLEHQPKKGTYQIVLANPYLFGVALFSSLGGFLFGYDQGVVSGILTMESFGAAFPRIYLDSGFKGWFVSTLLLAAWLGSLVNGPVADRIGRKKSIMVAIVIFTIGSAIQAAAVNVAMIFVGRAIAGLSVGILTMVIPLYMAEVSLPEIRGGLVVLQQLAITLGILFSFWMDYGTNHIGGTRCAPNIAYTGGSSSSRTFNPRTDVGPNGCTGQSAASWRVPFALQIVPGLILGIGMIFFPESPRWLMIQDRDDDAIVVLSKLRRQAPDNPLLLAEYVEIRAEVSFEQQFIRDTYPNVSAIRLQAIQYWSLFSNKSSFRRLSIGCCIMFFQQFIGCNAMIYYAPTIFAQLGLDGNTTTLLATGVYGIVNCLSTLPALFLIDKVGRRPLLMSGAFGTMVSLVIVAGIIGAYGDDLVNHKSAGWAGIAFIYIYDINFSYSFAPIGWVLPSEIFNLAIRSKAISITTSTTWMCNFIIGLVTPDMLDSITWGTYVFFAAIAFIALVFVYFLVPETRGKTLEDMDEVFGDPAAHEEKQIMRQIEAQLTGQHIRAADKEKAAIEEQIE